MLNFYDEGAMAHLQNFIEKFLRVNAASQYGASSSINAEGLVEGIKERFCVFHPETLDRKLAHVSEANEKLQILRDAILVQDAIATHNIRADEIVAQKNAVDAAARKYGGVEQLIKNL